MTLVGVFFLIMSLISVFFPALARRALFPGGGELMRPLSPSRLRAQAASRRSAARQADRPRILATDHTTEVDFQRIVASDRIGVLCHPYPLRQSGDGRRICGRCSRRSPKAAA